ncbi:LamG-like jellyroll fold domain-containing protein [Winogradskyella sp. A2]|uniref:LamG-like jellyroll fold domain-containing protein n=1 Tax=Winogradskyella sp. A2 TaxID=3366944 RepID=UPI00398C5041
MHIEITGGATVTQGSTVTVNSGNFIQFTITNVETNNCKKLKIKDVDISNTTDFDINPNNPKRNIKPATCNGGWKYLDFDITKISGSCSYASTLVTVEIRNQPDFTFTLEFNGSPEIYVLGGDPYTDIFNGDTATDEANGTFFGVVDEGASETRTYIIANIGSCPLDINALSSSNGDFVVSSPYPIPFIGLDPYYYIIFNVTFTAPVGGTGVQTSTITIDNTDTTTFTFNVEAEMFNENIPGPGGITADFRLWLKATRGINETASKVSVWKDLGTNGKDAIQPVGTNQPTFLDDATSNINFNPVVEFENDGATIEQFLYNTTNGFYSQDIFIVMIPDATIDNTSTRNTIFAGTSSGNANDITGVGLGDYSTEFNNEVISYNQDVAGGGNFNGYAELNSSYANAGIINIRNNDPTTPTGQDILYNSNLLTTSSVDDIAFANVGTPGPPVVLGTPYWIGKNFDQQGSLNGRVGEIFTFAERVSDADRNKIESYLGVKYGITLGLNQEATKDYINSFDTKIWDITANSGYNYHVAGIGRDSISDLNQKQSKTLNILNEVTIGLNNIYATNSENPNEFKYDGDFLVWGSNNLAYNGSSTNTISLDNAITTTLTRIDRKWKIVESKENIDGDVGFVYLSVPEAAFSGFAKGANEEYALVVSSDDTFANDKIIDVIPLKSDGSGNLQVWYDFDTTKFFSFAKAQQTAADYAMNITSGKYLVGESSLNLNSDNFTISAWVRSNPTNQIRTVMSKGDKLQLRLNASNQVEVLIDDATTPRFTSTIQISDSNWHHLTFVYRSGTIFLYIDGILDKTELDVVAPSPNFNRFAVGALYLDKSNIINPLLGEVDEIYVWDVPLTQDQVRYLMNQEIERLDILGVDYVSGKSLPGNSDSNLVKDVTWSHLRAYYNFNSFYGSTTEGQTDARNFLRINYLSNNKEVVENQTAPLPYVTASSGSWDNAATWLNNSVQAIPNTLGLDGATTIDWNIVEIDHDISSGDRDIELLALTNTTKLTLANPNESLDENNSGHSLTVTNYLEIDGVIDLVGESQLIQTEGSILDADSGGFIERDQQGTANSFNYNYWSSSVGPIVGNVVTRGTGVALAGQNSSLEDVLFDGTDSSAYQNINFDSSAFASDGGVSDPIIVSAYWLYEFYGPTDDYDSWNSINETSSILPGEGFTMKGSSGAADILNDFQNYVFKGLPNNGDITIALNKNVTAQNPSGNVDRLIGNPYPSALDVSQFILDNMSVADGGNNENGTIFNGAIYFWDHFGEENSHFLGDYVGGYATRNLLGGVAAISNEALINNTSDGGNPATGTKIPGPYVPVNQGFLVSTALDGFDNENETLILTVDGGDVVFNNGQRIFERESVGNSLFMKSNSSDLNTETQVEDTPMIRLIFKSPTGFKREVAIGLDPNASNEFDLGYDAFLADLNQEDMYWIVENNKFVIQGVNNFNINQEFPLGIEIAESGVFAIKLQSIENLDQDLPVYVKDNLTNSTFQLNNGNFQLFLDSGNYENRFSITFDSQENLSTDSNDFNENSIKLFFKSQIESIGIFNPNSLYISESIIYSITGQEVLRIQLNSSDSLNYIPVSIARGTYIMKLNTDKGIRSNKLIIN